MEFKKVNLVYFSATDVSKKYAQAMGKALEKEVVEYFTTAKYESYFTSNFLFRSSKNSFAVIRVTPECTAENCKSLSSVTARML